MERIIINNLPKLRFNAYNNLHWAKKMKFKQDLHYLLQTVTRKQYTDAYNLDFQFFFTGRKLDTINVLHYCKKIEDYLFEEDNQNEKICIRVSKSENENKCILTLQKV